MTTEKERREDLEKSFRKQPVGSPVNPCAGHGIQFVDYRGVVKVHLEVSNRLPTEALPQGFESLTDDRDNFRIEVRDSFWKGDTIPADKVELEARRPDDTPFSPPRKINVELKRVGTANLFRSKHLRLVVDEVDQAVNPAQMLLTDVDPSNEEVEILGQIVRVKYASTLGELKAEATVGNGDRVHIQLAVHVLRKSVGGPPVVSTAQAKTNILRWVRRVYAQISMAPKVLLCREVDPMHNLVAISNNHGKNATGGGSTVTFTVQSTSGRSQVVGPYAFVAGNTPMQTAEALAQLVRAGSFEVRTVQNPLGLEDDARQGSADLLITDPTGGHVSVTEPVGADATQSVSVARMSDGVVHGRWGPAMSYLVGTPDERALLHAYDTGSDRIDLLVVRTLFVARGQAFIDGTFCRPDKQALPAITRSAFVETRSLDGTDEYPFVIAHEIGHVLLEGNHVNGSTQVLFAASSPKNAVDAQKRFSEFGVVLDWPSQVVVQETRMRSHGAPMLVPFR